MCRRKIGGFRTFERRQGDLLSLLEFKVFDDYEGQGIFNDLRRRKLGVDIRAGV
jgi:hypothetical protein